MGIDIWRDMIIGSEMNNLTATEEMDLVERLQKEVAETVLKLCEEMEEKKDVIVPVSYCYSPWEWGNLCSSWYYGVRPCLGMGFARII